jgi:DNA-binding CsgD family transcriptional regulator
MHATEQLRQALVLQVYDAALDDSRWAGIVYDVAKAFNSHSTAIQIRAPEFGTRVLGVTNNVSLEDYEAHYGAVDPWVEGGIRCGPNRIVIGEDLISPAQWERSEFYCDYASKGDMYDIVGCVLEVMPTQVACLGIHRGRGQPRFNEADRRHVGEFALHLRRALVLRARLEQAEQAKTWALDALAMSNASFFVVDAQCKVIYATPSAASLAGPGRALRVRAGHLGVDSPTLGPKFARMVAAAVATAQGTPSTQADALALPQPSGFPLTIAVSPLPELTDSPPRALVFVKDTSKGPVDTFRLQSLFGLTAAEAGVAEALTRGESVQEISETLGVSMNTVRTHVKQVLAKTRTSRQGEFISLALRSVAGAARP